MTTTETTEATETTWTGRAQALRDSIVSRVDDMAGSGKAILAGRRDDRRRDQLVLELGELHFTAAVDGDDPNQRLVDRLVAEIKALDADAHDSGSNEARDETG